MIENLEDRNFIRAQHKNVHCRKVTGGFAIVYESIDKSNKFIVLGAHKESRAKAWQNAAELFYKIIITKLES
jgi:hypothetical protein